MSESKKRFAERLLAADPPSGDARGRYEREVRAMLEKTLTPRERGGYLMLAVGLLAPVAFFAAMAALAPPPDHPVMPYVLVYFAVTGVALAAVAAALFRAFWRGVVDRRGVRRWATGVGVAYVGSVGWVMMLMAQHTPAPLHNDARVFGLVLLVYAAVAWVRNRVAQAEMNTAERLLEIELRLAELAERRPPAAAPGPPAA